MPKNKFGFKNQVSFFILFCLFVCGSANAQDQFEIILQIDRKCSAIELDELGNVYIIDESTIEKYSNEGTLLQSYSNNIYGQITSLSFNTSLKPTLFFKELGYVVQLDNTLSEQAGYKVLQNYGYFGSSLLMASTENSFWIFDAINFKLKNINRSFVTLLQSNNLSQISSQPLQPIQMVEADNFIYLNNPSTGILVFDTYGSYIKTIPIQAIVDFCIFNEGLFYVKKGMVYRFGLMDLTETKIDFPLENIEKVRINKNTFLLKNIEAVFVLKMANKK